MPFRYPLQRVLNLMETREKTLDAEVMAAQRAFDDEQAQLDALELRKTAAQKGLGAQMEAGATPDVAASNDYIQALNLKQAQQAKSLKAAREVLEAAQERQTKARQERQKIEKHKEMKLDEWKRVEKKREAQRIDEMAGTIFMKRRAKEEEALLEASERMAKLEQLKLLRALREKRGAGGAY